MPEELSKTFSIPQKFWRLSLFGAFVHRPSITSFENRLSPISSLDACQVHLQLEANARCQHNQSSQELTLQACAKWIYMISGKGTDGPTGAGCQVPMPDR